MRAECATIEIVDSERTGAGDPAKTLQLLWGDRAAVPRRGPRQQLSIGGIARAAIDLADERGAAALSMRGIATSLGAAPMNLYTYVPGKAELLELMLDTVYAQMRREDTTGRPWRERATAVAEENRELYRTHPWAIAISTDRPVLGPGAMAKYEHELAVFSGIGLDDVVIDDSLAFLLSFVRSVVRDPAADSASTDEQWWQVNEPLLARIFDPTNYPAAARIGAAAGNRHGTAFDPKHAFDFGLRRVLDGLHTMIAGTIPD